MDRMWDPVFNYHNIDTTPHGTIIDIRDLINSYEYNSDGFRGADHAGTKVVAAGCSQTFGEGVPYEATWGSLLAAKLGYGSYANLGIRGGSTAAIVTRVFSYVEKYGPPDYIFLLAPDLQRIEYPLNPEESVCRWGKSDQSGPTHIHLLPRGEPRDRYIKRPYEVQQTLSQDFIDMLNMDYIRFLDYFCRFTNIKFKWSTWDTEFQNIYEASGDVMHSYVSLGTSVSELREIESNSQLTCHIDMADKYGANFHIGADRLADPDELGHMGVHQHVHIYEKFLESVN